MPTRDPELERMAVELLGLKPKQAACMLQHELEEALRQYDEQTRSLPPPSEGGYDILGAVKTAAVDGLSLLGTARPALSPSELQPLLQGQVTLASRTPPQARVLLQQQPEAVAQLQASLASDQDLQGLRALLVPLQLRDWCRQKGGLLRLHQHVLQVLQVATDLDLAITQKRQILLLRGSALDEEDTRHFDRSMQGDAKNLLLIHAWLVKALQELDALVQERVEIQRELQTRAGGSVGDLLAQLDAKTTKLRLLRTVLSTRIECLKVPKVEVLAPEGGAE